VSICRISLARAAPKAMRIEISSLRLEPRASNRLATLAQATSRTSAEINSNR
jgi:predicted DNA-binding protein